MFGQVVCQFVLVSCKQWFVRCCFGMLPRNLEKVSYCTFLLNLLGKLDASSLFVQVFMEFSDRKKINIPNPVLVGLVVFFVCVILKSSHFGLFYMVELFC